MKTAAISPALLPLLCLLPAASPAPSAQKRPLHSWSRHVVDAARPWRALFIASADVDGDGRAHILTGGWWYRNPGRPGRPWVRNTIGEPLHNLVAVADFDGDGRPDVLGSQGKASEANPSFVWAHNQGGGRFAVMANIPRAEGDFPQGIAVRRFQVGAPIEAALSWHKAGFGIQMLSLPAQPAAEPWRWRRIAAESQDEALSAGDIDGDGRVDLLLGTRWLQNQGAGWKLHLLNPAPGDPDRNHLADINRDGWLDAVVGFEAISGPSCTW